MLAIKLIHAGFTIYNRLKRSFLICKVIGMSSQQLVTLNWQILAFTGNVGIIFGVLVGFMFPQVLILSLRPFLSGVNIIIVPTLGDIAVVLLAGNLLFILSSLWVLRLKMTIIGEDLFD